MLTMVPAVQDPAHVLSACLTGVQDGALTTKLNAISPALLAGAAEYHQRAQTQTLHVVPRVSTVGGVTKSELTSLYTEQMSASAGAARAFYNAIRNSAKNDKCPLCGIGTVKVLDHHLPSSKYPSLSVCPLNLVPACEFCNNSKRAKYPKTAADQTLHPYYDDFSQEQWIRGQIDKTGEPVLVFRVEPPSHWPDFDKARADRHFKVVNLGHSYTSNANDELSTLRNHLVTINTYGHSPQVQAHLAEAATRYEQRVNSWQHVTYQTLASDAWFVDGGFKQIPV